MEPAVPRRRGTGTGREGRRARLWQAKVATEPLCVRPRRGLKARKRNASFRGAKRSVSHPGRKSLRSLMVRNRSFRGSVCFQWFTRSLASRDSQFRRLGCVRRTVLDSVPMTCGAISNRLRLSRGATPRNDPPRGPTRPSVPPVVRLASRPAEKPWKAPENSFRVRAQRRNSWALGLDSGDHTDIIACCFCKSKVVLYLSDLTQTSASRPRASSLAAPRTAKTTAFSL